MDGDRARVRHVGEQGSEQNHPGDIGRERLVDRLGREGLPPSRRLGAEQQVDVLVVGSAHADGVVGDRPLARQTVITRRAVERDPWPPQAPLALVVELDVRSIELKVVIVFGVDVGNGHDVEHVLEGAHGAARRFTSVVPAFEGDDQESPTAEQIARRH